MSSDWRPSTFQRCRGWLLGAPSRINYLFDSDAVRITDEDAFSASEGGAWAWYPLSGSFAPLRLGRWWHAAGRGASAPGSVSRVGARIRYVPNAFWTSRGVPDWEREVMSEDADGDWLLLTFDDGDTVLRKRRSSGLH